MKPEIDTVLVLNEVGQQVPIRLITPLYSADQIATLTKERHDLKVSVEYWASHAPTDAYVDQLVASQAREEKLRAHMLTIASACRIWGGEAERARKMLEEVLALPNEIDEQHGISFHLRDAHLQKWQQHGRCLLAAHRGQLPSEAADLYGGGCGCPQCAEVLALLKGSNLNSPTPTVG